MINANAIHSFLYDMNSLSYEVLSNGQQRRLASLLNCNSSGKQNIVFQMNMLMKIGFENGECFIERLVTGTCAGRRRLPAGRLSHCPQRIPRGIVFMFHHRNWGVNRTERRNSDGFIPRYSRLHPDDVGKQDHFFLHHVRAQFLSKVLEYLVSL